MRWMPAADVPEKAGAEAGSLDRLTVLRLVTWIPLGDAAFLLRSEGAGELIMVKS